MRTSTGRLFQSLGVAIAKAGSPLVFNRDLGCTNNSWLDDHSTVLGLYKSKRPVR